MIFIETESTNDFQHLVNILNWINQNSLELTSILGHSLTPLIELSTLLSNFEGSQDDFGNIGFILLVGVDKKDTTFEYIENVVDNNGLNECWIYIYATLSHLRSIRSSETGSQSLVAGYLDRPLASDTIELYPEFLMTQDLPQMQPIISMSVAQL